jgi:hypothetical protein
VTLDEVLGRLQGVRRLGTAKAQALCPAHDDREPSLSVDVGENGSVLMFCHAGCTLDDILAAAELTKKDLFSTETPSAAGDIVYDYVDEKNVLLSQVVRKPDKRFVQRRPDGTGGWIYKLKGVRSVVYRLPEILGADPSQVVFVVEGEKDVDNVRRLGLLATTNPGGTGNGRIWDAPSFREPLRGRNVVILPDTDEPGRKHAARVARALHACARSVKILALPDLPAKGDVSDWIAAGGTREKLQALVTAAAPWAPPPTTQGEARSNDGDAREERERPTQARLLVALAQEHAELFKTPDDEAYATIRDGETLAVRSKGFRSFLVGKFFATYDKTPSSLGLKEAADTLETLALVGGVTRTTFLRAGAQDDRLFVDLGDPSRTIVEIGPGRWRVVAPETVAIRFRRTSSMRPLPNPRRGGDINDLRRFLNVGDEEWRWRLLLPWLLFAFHPRGPFPVLVLQGEQGCAKSTTAKVLRALIDPSQAPLRLPPRDEDKLIVCAKSSWVLAFDNLSGMPLWLSDCLCCLATGTAQSKRALYTDDEEHIIEAIRPVIVNGIDDMTARPDFASRALAVDLPQIREDQRQEESEFWADFASAQPAILGAVLSVVADILAIRDKVSLPAKPRMADFARFGVAAERVLGWPEGSFLDAYQVSQADSAAVTLESNLVALAVHRFMNDPELGLAEFEDTATVLLPRLAAQLAPGQDRSRGWPANASQLGNQLRRCAPILRRYGIEAEQIRSHGERRWRLARANAKDGGKAAAPAAPAREPKQISMVDADGSESRERQAPSKPRHPEPRVTAGATGVTASRLNPSPGEGDAGAGLDGVSSSLVQEGENGTGDGVAPDATGGQP